MDNSSSALVGHSHGQTHPAPHHALAAAAIHGEHRSETWYELFYDLVFVAAALQLGKVIKYDHRPLGLVKASLLFLMLRSTWDHLTMYQNR
jgi:low temperature requirement protein LtrA